MLANTATFENQDSKNEQNDYCEVRQAYKDKDKCKVIVCSSQSRQSTQIFPLIKEHTNKIIMNIRLAQAAKNTKKIDWHSLTDTSQLLNAFYITSSEFGNNMDNYVQVSEKFIKVYDRNMCLRIVYEGLNIRGCQTVHQGYLYTISDTISNAPTIPNYEGSGEPQPVENHEYTNSGFFVFDLHPLLEGKIEKYKMATSIGGQCSIVNKDKFGNRFAFLHSYDYLNVIPFPHVNLIECVGMGQKSEYLIWREKNGFFTALDKISHLSTWSLVTGKLLYQEKQQRDASEEHMQFYEVYRADDKDMTYTQGTYNYDEFALTLLKSQQVVNHELIES